jgi:ribosomal-protein-alanine N-acetyltransferase
METARLRLRRFREGDAAFVLRLLNEPSFLRHIGDKNVRSRDDALAYIRDGPEASYARFGFGLMVVELKASGAPIGMCGLLKRDVLPDPDVGYAFLPEHWSRGYALEAAAAAVEQGRRVFGLGRILAVTGPDNDASIRLLEKLGFRPEGTVRLAEGEPEVRLFALGPAKGPAPGHATGG